VKRIGIMAREGLSEAGPALAALVAWLRERGAPVLLETATAAILGGSHEGCRVVPGETLAREAEAAVILGGDGTLLAASDLFAGDGPPVLGVNFGKLGFLTEVAIDELYPALEALLEDRFECEERRLLHAVVLRGEKALTEADVLNDVVVTKAALSRIVELEVTIDGRFVSAFRADGLIVSTTTGSTAYNLAAGGPILHPALPAVVLTPICPHTLTYRPLVVSDESVIDVRLCDTRDVEVHLTFDGQRGVALSNRDRVRITRSTRRLRLVRSPNRDYFEVLRTKLKWGESTARRR
jgi:NAD+ kinase